VATSGGQPGHKNANKSRPWADALRRALARKASGNLEHGLDQLADKVVSQAIDDGNKEAWKEIGERLDGKPAQALIGGEADDPPIRLEGRIVLRKPDTGGDADH
jgi:hypothetical protein